MTFALLTGITYTIIIGIFGEKELVEVEHSLDDRRCRVP
jgi:DNA-binding MarR family transcriptional regulator